MDNKNAASFDVSDEVFSRMANSYDILCDLFSLFAHRYWKMYLANKIANTVGKNFLDIAAGTGDIGLRVAAKIKKSQPELEKTIVMGDICEKMLAVAKKKQAKTLLIVTIRYSMHIH